MPMYPSYGIDFSEEAVKFFEDIPWLYDRLNILEETREEWRTKKLGSLAITTFLSE